MKPIELNKSDQQEAIRHIKEFFNEVRDESISDFQATSLLERFLHCIGPSIYNQAIADAHNLLTQKLDDLYGLEKRILP